MSTTPIRDWRPHTTLEPVAENCTPKSISRIVWQILLLPARASEVAANWFINANRTQETNPCWTFHLVDEPAAIRLMKLPEVPLPLRRAFFSINSEISAARADLVRYATLYLYGGMYLDIDICLAAEPPLDTWVRTTDQALLIYEHSRTPYSSGPLWSPNTTKYKPSKPRAAPASSQNSSLVNDTALNGTRAPRGPTPICKLHGYCGDAGMLKIMEKMSGVTSQPNPPGLEPFIFAQNFLIFAPGHPFLREVMARSSLLLEAWDDAAFQRRSWNHAKLPIKWKVLHLTGPAVWTQSVRTVIQYGACSPHSARPQYAIAGFLDVDRFRTPGSRLAHLWATGQWREIPGVDERCVRSEHIKGKRVQEVLATKHHYSDLDGKVKGRFYIKRRVPVEVETARGWLSRAFG